jgi:copper chaperone
MSANEDSTDRVYTVTGMTCDHCVLSVREEVSEVPGVSDVDVDLASGRLTVSGEGFTDDAVKAAVAEAGYGIAS